MYAGGLFPQDEKRQQEDHEAVTSAVPEVELVSPILDWFDINYRDWNKAQGFRAVNIGLKQKKLLCAVIPKAMDLLSYSPLCCMTALISRLSRSICYLACMRKA